MSKDASVSSRRQRDTDDQIRDRQVYRYLLNLTDLGLGDKGTTPNESSIAKQWGVADNRIFVRRVLRSVLFDELYAEKEEKPSPVPGLTLSKLVGILSALQAHKQAQQSLDSESKRASAVITQAEKLKALQLFAQLSPEERSRLSFKTHPEKALLDQILERATDQADPYTADEVIRLYRFFLQQLSERFSKTLTGVLTDIKDSSRPSGLKWLITNIVARYTNQYSQGLDPAAKDERDKVFVKKVRREIERIELQSGTEQANTFLGSDGQGYSSQNSPSQNSPSRNSPAQNSHSDNFSKHITLEFLQRLTHSVIDNELLTDEFPIHIKYFEIERVKPLPLYINQDNDPQGLLNAAFLRDNKAPRSVEGLARQVAYRVRVHFYIKPPDDYEVMFKNLTIFQKTAGQDRLEFSEEVVGVGCATSHIIAVINRVLLWDIPLLKDYIPIADGIHCNDEVMGGTPNSPVWSHCVARLYKREAIRSAIEPGTTHTDFVTTAEVASADFCGFDLLETMSKAALFARLQLIKQTLATRPNINADEYVKELCARVEEMTALKRARALLSTYPFSLRAMEGQLETTIFQHKYRKRLAGPAFQQLSSRWSAVALEAQLSIAEANLREGLLHIAKKYLDVLPASFDDQAEPVNDLLMARYCLCLFRYYYLSDLEDPACTFPDRHVAVRKAEAELEKAERYLQQRLQYYEKLDELTQSNLNPQFYFLSRIYAHRAKLYIFFPNYMPKLDRWNMLLEPIKLLEKARIYAARDGAPSMYAQWSAYQSWCYIMLAYSGKQEAIKNKKKLSYQVCLDWAERLIKHAEFCYSLKGKHCYQQIKDGGGRITEYSSYPKVFTQPTEASTEQADLFREMRSPKYYEKYGSTMVQVIPLIQELFHNEEEEGQKDKQRYQPGNHVVRIELTLLKDPGKDESSSIYLFGMHSSILLFAKGMFALCKTYSSDQALIRAVDQEAIRLFQYCCAIASDGTRRVDDPSQWPTGTEPGSIVLDRVLPKTVPGDDPHATDRLLQCFYPHRLTQFADLGKIFIIVCRLILLTTAEPTQNFSGSQKNGQKASPLPGKEIKTIRRLVTELRQNDSFPFDSDKTCGQKRYNGQLAEHYAQLERYVEAFIDRHQQKQLKKTSGIYLRDQMVTDIFEIIRGEVDVFPRM